MLENQGTSAAEARAAAAGWDGDIYRAYLKDEAVLIVLATTWDSEQEAREFSRACRAALQKKYPGFKASSSEADRTVYICGKGLGSGLLVRRGKEVFAVEGADAATVARILADLKALKIEYAD